MPFRAYLHNGDSVDDYVTVKTTRELRAAIHKMVEEKEDDWHTGDRITVEKISDVDAANEAFWEKITTDMRKGR